MWTSLSRRHQHRTSRTTAVRACLAGVSRECRTADGKVVLEQLSGCKWMHRWLEVCQGFSATHPDRLPYSLWSMTAQACLFLFVCIRRYMDGTSAIFSTCANPDADPLGAWCEVDPTKCESYATVLKPGNKVRIKAGDRLGQMTRTAVHLECCACVGYTSSHVCLSVCLSVSLLG